MNALDEYQAEAVTASLRGSAPASVVELALGLGAEVMAELVPALKPGSEEARWLVSQLGDCLWYVAASAAQYDILLTALRGGALDGPPDLALLVSVGRLQDLVRKSQYLGRRIDRTSISEELGRAFAALTAIADANGVSMDKIVATNQEKMRRLGYLPRRTK